MINLMRKNDQAETETDSQTSGQQQEEEEKKKKRADETMRTLDIYGVKSFMEARSKSARMFWLVLLILCTTIFIWQLYKTISNYINSPIVSTYTITTVPSMEFPIVYICPTSLISSLYLNKTPSAEQDAIALKEEMGILWDYTDFLASGNLTGPLPQQSNSPTDHVDPSALKTMRRKSHRFNQTGPPIESDKDAQEFFKNATVPLGEHVRYCEFRVFMSEKLQCANITREVLDPEFGKCYIIDVGTRQQTVQSQAMVLTYNVRSQWYPKSAALSPLFNGVHLSVQRKYNVDKSGESIILAPGTYYRVDLSAQHQIFKSFEHPYPQVCLSNDSLPNFEIYNVSYTQQSCQYDCAARMMKKACNCLPPVDSSLYADGVLNSTDGFCKLKHVQCIRNITEKQSFIDELKSCRDTCQRPCDDWRYSIRATSMDLYKYGFETGIPVHDLIFILVSFSQMEYTEFKQDNSKTPDQMIADLGGEAGLWLGAGMLTLIQLPLFFITVCGGCCKKRAKSWRRRKADGESEEAK